METLIATMGSISAQTVAIVPLPVIVHQVLRIWAVYFDIQSSSAAASIVQVLSHDVNLGTTLSVSDIDNQWVHAEQGRAVDSLANHIEVRFWPEPYEVAGPQRWVCLPSNGSVTPFITIHYTVRREPNLTEWTLLKSRTSHEED